MRRFYEQTLWILQKFLLTNPDLHHGLLGASFAAASVMILITSTILLITGHISQATFKDLVKFCLNKLAAFVQRQKPNESGDTERKLPSKQLHLPDPPSAPHVILTKDPSLPAPKEKPPQ